MADKALVIGATGLVGGALLAALEREGYEAVGASRSRALPPLRTLDLRQGAAVAELMAQLKPALVFLAVNPAGGVDACELKPDAAIELNEAGTRHAADAAASCGAKLVYFSTDYVFDGKAGPYDEKAAPRPLSAYGRAKRAGELIALAAPGGLVIRTTAVFGWDRASKNIAMQIWDALQGGRALKLPDDQWCTPTHAEFLAESAVRLARLGVSGVVNVVGKDRVHRAELGRRLAKAMALDPKLIEPASTEACGQKAPRPLQAGLKTEKLTELMGTEPWTLEESLARLRRKWRAETHSRPAPQAASAEAAALKAEILEKVARYHGLAHAPRPFKPLESRVPYSGRVYGAEELQALVDASLDFWLTLGPYGELFEGKLRALFGAKDCLFVNSGSSANLLAVSTLCSPQLERPLKPGDEVITPAVTFPTTLAPILQNNLVPVLVDCEIGSYNIDPALIEGALSERTRAMFIPHTLGNPADLDALTEIAKRRGLYLIEDCCDALGSTFNGRQVGTFGELATLSFYPAHHITTGEGGAVAVHSARLARIARSVRDWGRDCWCAPGESNSCGRRFGWKLGGLPEGYDHKYVYSHIGYNLKPTDLQAAVGTVQLDRLPAFSAARRANFKRLYEGLSRYADKLILPTLDPRSDPDWFALPLTVTGGVLRRELVAALETANIETRELFGGNIARQPGYADAKIRVAGGLERADRVMRDSFFIGVYPGLSEEMLAHVLATFARFFEAKR